MLKQESFWSWVSIWGTHLTPTLFILCPHTKVCAESINMLINATSLFTVIYLSSIIFIWTQYYPQNDYVIISINVSFSSLNIHLHITVYIFHIHLAFRAHLQHFPLNTDGTAPAQKQKIYNTLLLQWQRHKYIKTCPTSRTTNNILWHT